MEFFVGTSGWSYRHWRGNFYPPELHQGQWLEHYASTFRTVELNASFYRLPTPQTVAGWADRTPEDFVFAVKASRFMTHIQKLVDCGDALQVFFEAIAGFGSKLGPILFQLPPDFAPDAGVLESFVSMLPSNVRAAFEFRHRGWRTLRIKHVLARYGVAWVIAHSPGTEPAVEVTADWTYVRFHGGSRASPHYSDEELRKWAEILQNLSIARAFVYFNNDAQGAAPADAARLCKLLGCSR